MSTQPPVPVPAGIAPGGLDKAVADTLYVPNVGPSLAAYLGGGVQLRSIYADRSTWNEAMQLHQVNKPGVGNYTDPVYAIGYNMTPGFGKQVPTEPMFSDRWECGWYNVGNGKTSAERHIGAYFDPGNTSASEIRPYSIYIDIGADVVGGLPQGRPHHLWTVGTPGLGGNADGTWAVSDTSAALKMTFGGSGAGLWSLFTQFLMQGSAGDSSSLTFGLGLGASSPAGADATIFLDPGAGQTAAIYFRENGVSKWLTYAPSGASGWYLRDTTYGRMQITCLAGPNAGAATTEIGSNVQVDGRFVVGTAQMATNAADGFAQVTTMAGTPTAAPVAVGGATPFVFDKTNNKLWAYLNGAWKGVVLA